MSDGAERSANTMSCGDAQWELCRLAVGARQAARGLSLARHVRACPACDGFVDELGRLRQWLAAALRPPREPDLEPLEARARTALARELDARLARDLLAQGTGGTPRPLVSRRWDIECLAALRGASAARAEPWRSALPAVEERTALSREESLRLAVELDPLGLDVALAWLGMLVRSGRDEAAQAVAERLLLEVS